MKLSKKIQRELNLATSIFKDISLGKSVSAIAEDFLETINEKLGDKYREIFGNEGAPWEAWVENRAAAERINQERALQLKRSSLKSFNNKVEQILARYWEERYNEIIDIYYSSWNIGDYTRSLPYANHYHKKRSTFGLSAEHNGYSIRYLSPGLMTGYLKKSLFDAINQSANSGNDHLSIGTNPLSVNYKFDPYSYPNGPRSSRSYVEMFWNTANRDAGLDPTDIFKLGDEHWQLISKEIDILVENKIIPEFREALRNV